MNVIALPNGETQLGIVRVTITKVSSFTDQEVLHQIPVSNQQMNNEPDQVTEAFVALGLIEKRDWVTVQLIPEGYVSDQGTVGVVLHDSSDDQAHYVVHSRLI